MEAEFTKGPWFSRKQPANDPEEYEWRIYYDGSGCWLATVHLGVFPTDVKIAEARANARLIFAAPDMYAAGKLIVQQADEAAQESPEMRDDPLWKMIEGMRAALAKARGE